MRSGQIAFCFCKLTVNMISKVTILTFHSERSFKLDYLKTSTKFLFTPRSNFGHFTFLFISTPSALQIFVHALCRLRMNLVNCLLKAISYHAPTSPFSSPSPRAKTSAGSAPSLPTSIGNGLPGMWASLNLMCT